MKKNLLLLFMILLAFTACEGPAGPPGQNGTGMYWFVNTYTVRAQDWKIESDPDGQNAYYMAEVPVKELSNDIYVDGNMFSYLVRNPGAANETQAPLPYVLPIQQNPLLWTEVVSCEFIPGYVIFYVTYSDFPAGMPRPGDMEFRVVLNY